MIDYKGTLFAHLAKYKTERLGIPQQGAWTDHKGVIHYYDHILPDGLEYLNLLESIRAELRAYLAANPGIKLHKDFKHLNPDCPLAIFDEFEASYRCSSRRWCGAGSNGYH